MKPLIVLIFVFIVTLIINKVVTGNLDYSLAGKTGMSAMLLLTASGHFKFTAGMANMLPAFMPFKKVIIYFTGIIEIAAAVGFWFPSLQVLTGWLIIIF